MNLAQFETLVRGCFKCYRQLVFTSVCFFLLYFSYIYICHFR